MRPKRAKGSSRAKTPAKTRRLTARREHSIHWDELSRPRQTQLLRVAKRIALRESKNLRERYGPDVLSVGVGFITKGKSRRLYRDLVLRFFVRKKWSDATPDDRLHYIPPTLAIRTGRAGKQRTVRIPTDVNLLSGGSLQRTSVVVRPPGASSGDTGSICCVVRDAQSGDQFLLSCKHVFGLTDMSPSCSGRDDAKIHARGPNENNVATIDQPSDLADIFPDQDQFSIDAAIARILRPSTFRRDVDGRPVLSIQTDEDQIRPGDQYKLLGGTSGVINATVVGIIPFARIPVTCNGQNHIWLFRRLVEYQPSPPTQGGDSGSPLMDASILVGMHFYLQGDSPRHAFAMLAEDVIDQSTFNRRLELVPDPT